MDARSCARGRGARAVSRSGCQVTERTDALRELARATIGDPNALVDFLSDGADGHSVVLRLRYAVQFNMPAGMPLAVCKQRLREAYVMLADHARAHLLAHLQALGPTGVSNGGES